MLGEGGRSEGVAWALVVVLTVPAQFKAEWAEINFIIIIIISLWETFMLGDIEPLTFYRHISQNTKLWGFLLCFFLLYTFSHFFPPSPLQSDAARDE